jgi:ATP-dependent protease HslVU ATPase subunit
MEKNKALTPQETVAELDRYIVGQNKAKRAVAIALRNRWRRQQIDEKLRAEVSPKNILMIGPTGVGKTEIARRLAKISHAPFIKVEASKFTEVGYVGKDVESMIRDLMDVGVKLVKQEEKTRVQAQALEKAQEQIVSLLLEKHPVYLSKKNELNRQENDNDQGNDQDGKSSSGASSGNGKDTPFDFSKAVTTKVENTYHIDLGKSKDIKDIKLPELDEELKGMLGKIIVEVMSDMHKKNASKSSDEDDEDNGDDEDHEDGEDGDQSDDDNTHNILDIEIGEIIIDTKALRDQGEKKTSMESNQSSESTQNSEGEKAKHSKTQNRSDGAGDDSGDDHSHLSQKLEKHPQSEEEQMALDEELQALKVELLAKLKAGLLDEEEVTIKSKKKLGASVQIIGGPGGFPMDDVFNHLKSMRNGRVKEKTMKVKDAIKSLVEEESDKLVDMDKVIELSLDKVQNHGMIFLDEIDKIALSGGRGSKSNGPDVSRGGVQRDLLPIVEGSVVNTKYGVVHTDHILFIAAGAFHETQVSDLIPELQGRFPIRVELDALNEEDFYKILTETANNLIKQYQALLATESVVLHCQEGALRAIAKYAYQANRKLENIGARRLHTVLENLFEEISYEASLLQGQTIEIDEAMVQAKLGRLLEDEDLSRYIL